MHYCFEATHSEIHTARIWASKNEVSDDRVNKFRANEERYKSSLDGEVARLNAFMTVAMSQLERIGSIPALQFLLPRAAGARCDRRVQQKMHADRNGDALKRGAVWIMIR